MQEVLKVFDLLEKIKADLDQAKADRDKYRADYIKALERASDLTKSERLFIEASNEPVYNPMYQASGVIRYDPCYFNSVKFFVNIIIEKNQELTERCFKLTDKILASGSSNCDCNDDGCDDF
jgi:hypothetical protein